ncbi:unnamed protein product [Ascophyllum nodosum]
MSDAIATGSGRGYLSRFQRDGTARAEASQLEHSPVSATGDARKMRSPPSRGQTAARGVIAAGSDRGHAAGSRRGSAAGFETSQQVRSRVSAAGYPHIFFSSMGWTTAGVVVDAARSARKSHEKRRQETMMALMARQRRQAALAKRRKEAEEEREDEQVQLALEVRRSNGGGVPREGRRSPRVRVSHAARGPEPPPANVNTVDANRDGGEGGDRERGGGEAASVEMNMSLEDTLQFIMETWRNRPGRLLVRQTWRRATGRTGFLCRFLLLQSPLCYLQWMQQSGILRRPTMPRHLQRWMDPGMFRLYHDRNQLRRNKSRLFPRQMYLSEWRSRPGRLLLCRTCIRVTGRTRFHRGRRSLNRNRWSFRRENMMSYCSP